MKVKWDVETKTRIISGIIIAVCSIAIYFLFLHFDAVADFIKNLFGILQPFIFGLAFAFIINLPMVFIENRFLKMSKKAKPRKKLIRAVSLLLALLFILISVALVFALIIPQFVRSANNFIGNFKGYMSSLSDFVSDISQRLNIDAALLGGIVPTVEQISSYVVDYISTSIPEVINLTSQITSTVINVIIGLIISVYLLFSKEAFMAQTKKILYAIGKKEHAHGIIRVAGLCNRTFTGFISGKLIDSLIIGVLCFVGLTAMRMPYTLLISVIIGVTNVIPFFGPIIGAVPATLIVILVDPFKALLLVLFIVALQQFDGNILGPRILGDSTGLPTIWVMFSIIVGGGLFGFVGMLVSVPLFAVAYTLIREAVSTRLKKRDMPSSTEAYDSPGVLKEKTAEKVQNNNSKD